MQLHKNENLASGSLAATLRLRQASESSSFVSGTTLGTSPKALSDAMVAI
jgi:hypothetical protein